MAGITIDRLILTLDRRYYTLSAYDDDFDPNRPLQVHRSLTKQPMLDRAATEYPGIPLDDQTD